jgi:hypothetical protein
VIPPPAPSTPSLRHSIKVTFSDYPKLKDLTQWSSFDCQLRYKTANQSTIDALTLNYVPPIHGEAFFQDYQRFIYNVITNNINTIKGNNCACEDSTFLE